MDLQVCNLKEVHDSGRSDSYLLIGVPVHGQELCSIRKIRNQIKNKDPWKKVVVFATGLRRADEHVREKILQYNFKGERPDAFFYFSGGLDPERLSSNDRMLLRLQQMMISRHPGHTEDDLELLGRMKTGGDFTDRQQIIPLIEYLKGL